MSEVHSTHDNEIDLGEFFLTLWDGKWKIVGAIIISTLSVFGYQLVQPLNFEANTDIKVITSIEAEKYRQSNALGFFEITPNMLLNLYIEQLEARTLFEEVIREHRLLDVEKFEDEQAYNEAVIALASSIEILPPISVGETANRNVKRYWTIRFKYNDADKWKQVLSSVDLLANQSVIRDLRQRFETSLSVAKQKRDFELEDIQTQMANVKHDFDREMAEFELRQGFQLEDIEVQLENALSDIDKDMEEFQQDHQFQIEDITLLIENALSDYDRTTADRLAFLKEQAAIARKLGISQNTIEVQMFSGSNGSVTNLKTDTPFYMRGYQAIEKEIELIESREDKRAFVSGLFELEQKKRKLEQDKTLQRAEKKKSFLDVLLALEKQKRNLEQDRTLQRVEKNKVFLDTLVDLEKKKREIEQNKAFERAAVLFASTPIFDTNNFSAVSMTVEATEFEGKSKMLLLTLAIMLGGIIGVVYVLISHAIGKRKEQLTRT